MRRQSGFTLVELAIVLVIIGLIVGGILVGTDLIKSASIRSSIQQLSQYSAAVNTFRTKYNCLPGDCANAVTFGLGTDTSWGGHNGDGNGIIPTDIGTGNRRNEFYNFWYHMFLAGLIPDQVIGYSASAGGPSGNSGQLPVMKLNKTVYIAAVTMDQVSGAAYYINTGNSFITFVGTGCIWPWCGAWNGGITALEAQDIDLKLDDGFPESGNIVLGEIGAAIFHAYGSTIGSGWLGCHTTINQYDVLGAYYMGGADPSPNPSRQECFLVFGKQF